MILFIDISAHSLCVLVSSLNGEDYKPQVKLYEIEVVGKCLSRVQLQNIVSVSNNTLIIVLALSFTDGHTSQGTKTEN